MYYVYIYYVYTLCIYIYIYITYIYYVLYLYIILLLHYYCNAFQLVRNSLYIIHYQRHGLNRYYFFQSNIPVINFDCRFWKYDQSFKKCEFVKN